MLRDTLIRKDPATWPVQPWLGDLAAARADFSWEAVRSELLGTERQFLNIGQLATDVELGLLVEFGTLALVLLDALVGAIDQLAARTQRAIARLFDLVGRRIGFEQCEVAAHLRALPIGLLGLTARLGLARGSLLGGQRRLDDPTHATVTAQFADWPIRTLWRRTVAGQRATPRVRAYV